MSTIETLPDCCLPDGPTKTSWARLGGFVLAAFGLYLILEKTGLAQFSPAVGTTVGLGSVLVVGLASTLSSCGALVTGLIAASDKPAGFHLRFHAGRLAGFAALGALLGLVGGSLSFSPAVSGVLVLAIAVIMIGFGLKMVGALPSRFFAFKTPAFVSRLTGSPMLLGAATFFLPCGFTQAMQLYAASTGSPSKAALVMFLFALGAAPPLLGLGLAAQAGRKHSKRFNAAAGVVVATLGILNGQNGLTLLGVTSPSAAATSTVASTVVNGEQVVQMEATPYGTYEPSTISVKAGIPVRWQVYGADRMGCISSLVYREGGIVAHLKPGLNELSFTPRRSGTYRFSCSMGMARGKMIVE